MKEAILKALRETMKPETDPFIIEFCNRHKVDSNQFDELCYHIKREFEKRLDEILAANERGWECKVHNPVEKVGYWACSKCGKEL